MEPYPFDPVRDGYPSFALLFEWDVRVPDSKRTTLSYLLLLGLPAYNWNEAVLSLRAVRYGMRRSPDVEAEVTTMFHAMPWRTHLVAATCVALGVNNEKIINTLWQTFDNVIWVAPQLAAAAFLQDPLFEERARARIMNDYERQYSKALAALVGLCRLLPAPQT